MKLVALIALALLPAALGTPVADDTDATGKPAPGSTGQYQVTTDVLPCFYQPNPASGERLQYISGAIVTGTCWSYGQIVAGNPYWIRTIDTCYSSYAYLKHVSGGINQC